MGTLPLELASKGFPQEMDGSEPHDSDLLEKCLAPAKLMDSLEMLQAAVPYGASPFEGMGGDSLALLRDTAGLLLQRFKESWRLEDLDMSIQYQYRVLQQTPEDHPDWAEWHNILGASYQYRYKQLGQLEDAEKATESNQKAVLLTPNGHPDKPGRLSNLGTSYQLLFERLGRLDDLHTSVSCEEQAVLLTPDGHPAKPACLNNLGNSYQSLFERLGGPDDLHTSVSCIEQAVLLAPDGHPDKPAWLNNLGNSYQLLFQRLGRLDDLHTSVSCFEQAVLLAPDGHPNKPACLNNLGVSYLSLFEQLGGLDDLHTSVSCKEQAVSLAPDGHPEKPGWLNNLGNSYQLLFKRLGRLDDLHTSVSCIKQAVSLAPDGHPDKPRWLNNLGNSYQLLFQQLGRLDDLHTSVSCKEQAVSLTPDGRPDQPEMLKTLGISYQSLFERSGRLQDANQATSFLKAASMLTPANHPGQSMCLDQLGRLYFAMFKHSQLHDYALHSMSYFRHAALIPTAPPSLRLESARRWAQLSRPFDLAPLEAYGNCMMLLPQVVWLGTAVRDRYERLARDVGILVTEAAAVAISLKRHELALEWLEQGRSVVWGQTLQLRTPYDELHAVHPEMAEELQYVSNEFDIAGGGEMSYEATWKHRRLSKRREELLEYARQLPGLGDFLRPPKATTIMSWVQDMTTVIVNVHKDQCDALVIRAGTHTITHVPLIGFSVQKADRARSELALCLLAYGIRRGFKVGDERRKPTFTYILAMLWNDVVKPVLDHLGIVHPLPVDDLPHITWCTTGPLSFLPLHAAGDYSNPNTVLSNLAVSSYTPTVSSLKPRTSPPATFTGILAVGHASAIRGLSALPGTMDELDRVEERAKGLPLTRLDEEKARTDAVLHEMNGHSWVHFACHASQDKVDPTKSALHLHDGDLDLTTISRNSLKNAQLAFLSACQTATGDSALPDESVHLAAGLLMAGYPTVIATMWSIGDRDAPIVADEFYKWMLESGVPNSGKAAVALHKAVARLRDEIGVDEFARWVPYVHIGR